MNPLRPPDRERPGSAAARPGRESGSPGQRAKSNSSGDPREVQDFRPRRNATQRAPTWPKPPGSEAADALDRAFHGSSTRYVVIAIKAGGKRATLLTTSDRAEAERWLGMHRRFAADCGAELRIEVQR